MLEDKASLVLLQRLMTAPTLESYVARGRQTVAEWAQSRFQRRRNKPPDGSPAPPRPPPEGVLVGEDGRIPRHEGTATRHAEAATTAATAVVTKTAAEAAAEIGDGGAGGEDWWCVKAAGGNGGLDIWVLHEGNWKSVAESLSDGESYVIQVRLGGRCMQRAVRRVQKAPRTFSLPWRRKGIFAVLSVLFIHALFSDFVGERRF